MVLWVRSSIANQRKNGDHSTTSRLTDNLYRARLNDRSTRDKKELIRKPSYGKRLVDKYEHLSVGKMPPKGPKEFQKLDQLRKRGEPSCVKRKNYQSVRCGGDGSTKNVLIATCRDSSLNACHSSVPKYAYKKCKPTLTYYAACGRSFVTDCECDDD